MIKQQRKIHLQVWSLFALLVPAVIILAFNAVPQKVTGGLFEGTATTALPVVLVTKQTKQLSASIRRSSDGGNYQLQVTSPEAIVQPSSLIYDISNSEQELVGRIGPAGNYFFPLKTGSGGRYRFIIYDIIHRQVTDSLKFEP